MSPVNFATLVFYRSAGIGPDGSGIQDRSLQIRVFEDSEQRYQTNLLAQRSSRGQTLFQLPAWFKRRSQLKDG